jgi:uncharacterized protein (UPF0303 family)
VCPVSNKCYNFWNYLALDVVIDKQKLTLLSLYGPNMDNPDFYDQIMNIIEDFGNERYLLY